MAENNFLLQSVCPKLPMRNCNSTLTYYQQQLGFSVAANYGDYLIMSFDNIEIHFFLFENLLPKENYGQVYIRTHNIQMLYNNFLAKQVAIHPNGALEKKPWGQQEFSLLDPDNNLITFGEAVEQ
jgi:hypothetical protein